jgi:hypothetical protein
MFTWAVGLVEQGQRYYHLMQDLHKIEPTLSHYACMICNIYYIYVVYIPFWLWPLYHIYGVYYVYYFNNKHIRY